jgi:hypothetical protein
MAFHAYVDPIYGDDARALSLNPGPGPSGPMPLQRHAALGQIPGFLQHAPYSFRTVGGALGWFRQTFPESSPGNGKRLPWPNPDTQDPRAVAWLVIHCLPGLYGPADYAGEFEPESGLPWNGDTFPIDPPQRVSIQGTSALDTIFDARRRETSIFHIFWPNPDDGHEFQHTFIDSVTIRGARGFVSGTVRNGAGVLIDDESDVEATIGNCILTDNVVGIGVWKDVPDHFHRPIIVNNTFAWNQVGLYNSATAASGNPGYGMNELRVLNNVFDTSPPSGLPSGHVTGVSAFEGVDLQDLLVTQRNTQVLLPGIDFNAYEFPTNPRRANIGDSTAPGVPYSWPRTRSRSGTPTTGYSPVVSIQD